MLRMFGSSVQAIAHPRVAAISRVVNYSFSRPDYSVTDSGPCTIARAASSIETGDGIQDELFYQLLVASIGLANGMDG